MARAPQDLADAAGVVLPGVGAFGDGMAALRRQGLVEALRRHAATGRPLLGICLGMQLLADSSEEHGLHAGLGIVPGRVRRLAPDDPSLRVPNIGWCDVDSASYYFAHGFHMVPDDPADAAQVFDYGGPVVAAVRRGSVAGVQYHPEKSQDAGLEALAAFAAEAA